MVSLNVDDVYDGNDIYTSYTGEIKKRVDVKNAFSRILIGKKESIRSNNPVEDSTWILKNWDDLVTDFQLIGVELVKESSTEINTDSTVLIWKFPGYNITGIISTQNPIIQKS